CRHHPTLHPLPPRRSSDLRRSASQIMDAPMRHFTEYAGLRPSTLTRTVAAAPPVTRFSLTRGVRPMLSELSAKTIRSKTQISQRSEEHTSELQSRGHLVGR